MGEKRAGIGRCVLASALIAGLGLAAHDQLANSQEVSGPGREVRLAQASKKKGKSTKKGKTSADATKAEGAKVSDVDDPNPRFSRDVAPVLVGNCIGCHDPKSANNRAHVLDLTTYKGLMSGSTTRKVIEPGKPDTSPLILRIKGAEMPRMPPTANVTIGDPTIQRIAAWIAAGAKLDTGREPSALITTYAMSPDAIRLAGLSKLNANDRDKRVIDAAMDRWKKIMLEPPPEADDRHARSSSSTTCPNREPRRLKKLMDDSGERASANSSATEPPHPLDGPFKLSIYVFNDTNNFVEFARSPWKIARAGRGNPRRGEPGRPGPLRRRGRPAGRPGGDARIEEGKRVQGRSRDESVRHD